ncbi:hypothetical protein D3C87_318950 [compost metagenome]
MSCSYQANTERASDLFYKINNKTLYISIFYTYNCIIIGSAFAYLKSSSYTFRSVFAFSEAFLLAKRR